MTPPVHWKTLPVKASVQGVTSASARKRCVPLIVPWLRRTVPVPVPLVSVPWKWLTNVLVAPSLMRSISVPAAGWKVTVSKSPFCPGSCKVPESTATVLPGVLLSVMSPAKANVPVPAVLVSVPVFV